MKREDLSWLLGLANDMRAAHEDDLLDDLPESYPEDASACIIANAFNYDCEVQPLRSGPGRIYFATEDDKEKYLTIVGEKSRIADAYLVAELTPELNEVALAFDDGEYNEYVPNLDERNKVKT
jgi:hypothetical protein